MSSVNKKFAVEKGLEVGDQALIVDADNNLTGIGKTDAKFGLDVATTANFDGIVAAGQVGIGSTQPQRNLDVIGAARVTGQLYDTNNAAGNNQNVLISVGTGISWTDNFQTAADGTDSIQFKKSNARFGGASNFVFDPTNKRVGIGSTLPEYLLQVVRNGSDSANGFVQIGGTFLDSNATIGVAASILAADASGELIWVRNTGSQVNNILYVSEEGHDSNDGLTEGAAKRTIEGATAIAVAGNVIRVSSGIYTENNPVTVPANVTIDGDELNNTQVVPSNAGADLFEMNNGSMIQNLSFIGAASTGSMVCFAPSGVGIVTQSPLIRNCTNYVPNSVGLKVDGDHAEGEKSITADSYTMYNQGGIGVTVSNDGHAQLNSVYSICNQSAITCVAGATADVHSSEASFGTFGLIASGVGTVHQSGILTATVTTNNNIVNVANLTQRPFAGQVLYLGELFNEVTSISITSAGSGYTATNPPTVTFGDPSGTNGITAEGSAVISGFGSITSIKITGKGSQYRSAPAVTISAPSSGVTATATASLSPTYHTINSATPVVSGISTITLDKSVPATVGVGSTVPFAKQSFINASSYIFEHVGSGLAIDSARPIKGGVSVPENQTKSELGGKIIYSSTDEKGNLKLGDNFVINQQTGKITGDTFDKNVQSTLTPLLIALGGNL
tara:strand:- start:40567 stop:42588 length:2022 start_codon:yes stop_codon:yes gene_type:complete